MTTFHPCTTNGPHKVVEGEGGGRRGDRPRGGHSPPPRPGGAGGAWGWWWCFLLPFFSSLSSAWRSGSFVLLTFFLLCSWAPGGGRGAWGEGGVRDDAAGHPPPPIPIPGSP